MAVVCSEGSLTPRKYKPPIFFVRCNAFEAGTESNLALTAKFTCTHNWLYS